MFVSVLLVIEGILNIIYGLGAIGGSSSFQRNTHYLVGNLDAWGWVTLIIGIVQLAAAGSVLQGHKFGRYVGIAVGAVAAITALLDIRAMPFWSLAVFAVSIWIIYGLATYSEAGLELPYDAALGPDESPPIRPRSPV
jgi:hypothetical protein